jgi:hypothetical protein
VPAVQLGTYGIALSSMTTGVPGNELELRVRETATGPVLQYEWLGFASDSAALINSVAISPADLMNGQLELSLTQTTAGIDARYAFGNGNTFPASSQRSPAREQQRDNAIRD